MKKYLLAACAALALGGSAYAVNPTDEEYDCMHYGPASRACQSDQQQDQWENQMRAQKDREDYEAQQREMFGR